MTCWRCGDPSDEPTCPACVASFDRLLAEIVDRWGLPHAGEHRVFAGLDEAAGWVDALAALGYTVPPGMTDDMRVEARCG